MSARLGRIITSLLLPGILLLAGVAAGHAADIQKRNLRLSSGNVVGHPQVTGAQKFADLVKERTDGKITIKLFPGSVLGYDIQVISALQGGTIDFHIGNASLLAGNVKEFTVYDFPLIFNSVDEAGEVLDGPFGKKLFDLLPARGLIGLAYWDLGFRHITNSRRPMAKAADIAGLKIRVIPTPIYVDFMNRLGANAVPMPFTETYTALETGAVDGMTNPLITITTSKFYDVQKYLTLTNHMYNPQAVILSKKTWDKLSGDERKIIQEAAAEVSPFQRRVSQEEAGKALEFLKNAGMKVNEFPPEEMAKLREKAQPVIEKYTQEVGPELVAELYAEIEKVRGKRAERTAK